ncbi:MAG TPA: chromosome segregation protein SMC, partial [Gammaproteobacteria bacterium]|nr:chromosome segregation protein SMC [Gammaproteobacteria bacterium]
GLAAAPRLAEQLNVAAGWEQALETVLGPTLEAVCVENLEVALPVLEALQQGWLQLIDTREGGSVSATIHGSIDATLLSKVDAPLALQDVLAHIYVAADLPQALSMRQRFAAGESVVTADGIWIGRGWLRVAREVGEHGGVLAREAEIKKLREEEIAVNQIVEDVQTELAQGQALLQGLEQLREQLQAENNQAHRMQAATESRLGQARQRLEQIAAREMQLIDELRYVQEHLARDNAELRLCIERRDQAVAATAMLADERKSLVVNRPGLQRRLTDARAAARERQEQAHKLALRLEAMRTAHSSTQQVLIRAQAQLDQFEQRQLDLETTIEQGAEPLLALEQALADLLQQRLDIERELTMARTGLQDIENDLCEQDKLRIKRERGCEILRAELDTKRMAWQDASIRCQTLKEQFQETGFQLDTLIDKLESDRAHEPKVEQWEAQVENLKTRIDRLGAINLAAIDDFREQSERKTYLDCQHADLTEALETLENAIHKIDQKTRHRFKETFDRVNASLQVMFPRLFSGGQAHLEMIDDDWLTTGIALMARPPGKRLATIHLMSGGEKALTAVALVFAIFELNPAPFCLLDEVDAPLDDINVGRFCELVKEMSQRVQFIFI